jgi:hypothetical protein
MGKKAALQLYIGIAWPGSGLAEAAAAVEPYLETFAQTPLHWVLPSHPALEKRAEGFDRVITEIKARVSRIGDAVIPAGYSGAPHPLLGLAEIRRELEWSLHNPWGSGVSDVFRKKPDVLIAAAPDFSREKAVALYADRGFRSIGVPLDPGAGVYRFRAPSPDERLAVFHYFDAARLGDSAPTRFVRSFFPRDLDRLFLLVRPDGRFTPASLFGLIDALRARRALAVAAFPEAETAAGTAQEAAPGPYRPAAIADSPFFRLLREKAARLRSKGNLKNHEMRELLVLTAGDPAELAKARSGLAAKETAREGTAYTANMPGEILLPGNGFDAFFSGGRLLDLRAGRKGFLPACAPRAWAALAGREQPLPFDRIFSFEKNDLRGLETFVLFPGPEREHVFTLRYAFAGEAPWLIVSAERLRRPSAAPDRLTAVAPLEIPVGECSPNAPLVVRHLYADGSEARTAFSGDEPPTALAGTVFSVARAGRQLVFGYVPHKIESVSLLEVRVVRDKRRAAVYVNPFGAYRRESICELFAAGESRSFYIGVREEEPDRAPFFSASVNKSIPSHRLYRLQ